MSLNSFSTEACEAAFQCTNGRLKIKNWFKNMNSTRRRYHLQTPRKEDDVENESNKSDDES
jgi:hypothetical protein